MIYKQVPMLTHQQDGKGVRGYPIGREQHSQPEIENIKATATYYD
jgi:hypothetical protein